MYCILIHSELKKKRKTCSFIDLIKTDARIILIIRLRLFFKVTTLDFLAYELVSVTSKIALG